MTRSMTGYASGEGSLLGWRWTWEIRSVNGRGLDLRLRLPDQIDGLEAAVRKAIQGVVARGNVTATLRLARVETAPLGFLNLDALRDALETLRRIEEEALAMDLSLAETRASDIVAMRGVLEVQAPEEDGESFRAELTNALAALLADLNQVREREGAALEAVILRQIEKIDVIVGTARGLIQTRSDHMTEAFRAAATRLRETTEGIDEARIAQELALLAIKADITEELDRLDAHVAAARDLLAEPGPKGRKLDFLTQEFNREANTLCSKAQFAELTRLGLDLKHTIDQVREQVQNVE